MTCGSNRALAAEMVSLKRGRHATAGPSTSVVDAKAPKEGEFNHFTQSTCLHFENPKELFLSMCRLTEIHTDESTSTTSNKQLKRKKNKKVPHTDLTSQATKEKRAPFFLFLFFFLLFFFLFFQLGVEEGWGVKCELAKCPAS